MLTDKAKEIVTQCETKMQDAINFLEEDLKSYRVGKANPLIFNNVTVDYYGTPTPLPQVASISDCSPQESDRFHHYHGKGYAAVA